MKCHQTLSILSLLAVSSFALAEPDLICSQINGATSYFVVDGIAAYSFGTTICNIGNTEATWIDGTNQNPLVSQTLYRLADSQLHQLGIGFAHYATPPLASNACGLGCTPAGFNALGAGCSTTSSSLIHGLQGTLVPRTEINPFTGFYPYPFTAFGQVGDAIYKRLQVPLADISDPDALYFVETQLITESETTPETRANNASYRQVTFTPGSASANLVGPTYTEQPAIFAWRDHGLGIGMPDPDVLISEVTIPNDGIIHVGSKATLLGDDDWRFDYVIHNQNAEQIINWVVHTVSSPFDGNFNFEFHNATYHDDLDNLIEQVEWSTETFSCNSVAIWQPLADFNFSTTNAIRWGTAYSYSNRSSSGPANDTKYGMTIAYTSPIGDTGEIYDIDAYAPQLGEFCRCGLADLAEPFETLNFFDVSAFLGAYGAQDPNVDFAEPFGTFNFFDVSVFLSAFAEGCP